MLRFIEHFSVDQGTGSVVPRFVDAFGRLVTVTAATERLLKALRINNEEILSVEDLWVSSTGLGRFFPMV